jgi:hypothetical protein
VRISPFASLFALAAVVAPGCAATSPAPVPPRELPPVADAGTTDALPAAPPTSVGPSAEERAYQAELDLRDRLADRRITFAEKGQPPPKHPFRVPAKGPFPKREAIARAELLTFRRSRIPGCSNKPVTPNGAYCPDVVAPVATATDEELEALVPIAQGKLGDRVYVGPNGQKRVSKAVVRCGGFDPHHAVVFYDRDGRALGTIVVCFTCHEWLVTPGNDETGGDTPSVMSAAERQKLQDIFEAHKLGARLFGDDDYADRVHAYERQIYGTRLLPTPAGLERRRQRLLPGSGVPKDRPMRDLGKDDRAKLCGFVETEVRPRHGGAGYECLNGARFSVDADPATCAKAPWTCAATVGEVETCLSVFHEPNDLCGETKPECKAVLGCLPGVRVLP